MTALRTVVALGIAWLLATGCGGSGGGGSSSTTASSGGDLSYLRQHNARFLDNHTIRWDLPINTFTGGALNAEGEILRWTAASGGKVVFNFVTFVPGEGISIQIGNPGGGICGSTTTTFDSSGRIRNAEVTLAPTYTSGSCRDTVAHEVGHGIGYLDHSADGGLMDPDGGSGEITTAVSDMMRLLYSLPPGTDVSGAELARGAGWGRYDPSGRARYRVTVHGRPGPERLTPSDGSPWGFQLAVRAKVES